MAGAQRDTWNIHAGLISSAGVTGMKGPLAVENAWHWHLLFDQLLYRSPPLPLPTATGGSDALLPASCQHPTSISPASLGLLGTGQAHLSMPHHPAAELLAALAHHRVPERRRRDAEHLRMLLPRCLTSQSQSCTQGCKSSIQAWEGDCTSKAEEGLVTGG